MSQDSCYESSNDPPGVSQIDTAVRLCVTVVNFAPESKRAVQMVVCLSRGLFLFLFLGSHLWLIEEFSIGSRK